MVTPTTQSSIPPSQNPVNWSDILDALDPLELPNWPLLSPEVCYMRCALCPWKFYSVMNLIRHVHAHHHTLSEVSRNNLSQNLPDKLASLSEFWDKLSSNDFKDLISLKDVELEGVPGHIIVGLASIQKPDNRLSPVYLIARHRLLNVLQSEQPEFPITSDEFFQILKDASERTFFGSDMDESYQNYVFSNDAVKIDNPERENLVACTCFLLEQKLVKKWLQTSLVKEEEDEQRRLLGKTKQTEKNSRKKQQKKRKACKENDEDKNEEGNPGDTSSIMPLTGEPRSDSPPFIEDLQTQVEKPDHLLDASQIYVDEKEEEDEDRLQKKERPKEQKSEDRKSQDMIDTSNSLHSDETDCPGAPDSVETQFTQRDYLTGASQVSDAEKEEAGGFKQEDLKAEDQKSEDGKFKDIKNTSKLLHSSDTLSCSVISKDSIETQVTQPDQPVSLQKAEVLSDEGKPTDAECSQERLETKELRNQVQNFGEACKETSDIFFHHAMGSSSAPSQEDLHAQLPDGGGLPSKDTIQTQVTEPDESPSYDKQVLVSDSKKNADTKISLEEPDTMEPSFRAENIEEEDEETSDISCSGKIWNSSAPPQDDSQSPLALKAKLSAANELIRFSSEKNPVAELAKKKEIKQIIQEENSKVENTGDAVENALKKLKFGSISAVSDTCTKDDLHSKVTHSVQLTSSPIRHSDSGKDAEEHSKVKLSGAAQSGVQLSDGMKHAGSKSHSEKSASGGAQSGVQISDGMKHAGSKPHSGKYASGGAQSGVQISDAMKHAGSKPHSGKYASGGAQSGVQLSDGMKHAGSKSHSGSFYSGKYASGGAQSGVQRSDDQKQSGGSLQPVHAHSLGAKIFNGHPKSSHVRGRQKPFIPRHQGVKFHSRGVEMGQPVDIPTVAGVQACLVPDSSTSTIKESDLQDKRLAIKLHGHITIPVNVKHNLIPNAQKSEYGKRAATTEQSQRLGQHETGSAASFGTAPHNITNANLHIGFDDGECHISFEMESTDGTSGNTNLIHTDCTYYTRDGSANNSDIAPLADDPDSITRAKDNLAKAWEWMLSRRSMRGN